MLGSGLRISQGLLPLAHGCFFERVGEGIVTLLECLSFLVLFWFGLRVVVYWLGALQTSVGEES